MRPPSERGRSRLLLGPGRADLLEAGLAGIGPQGLFVASALLGLLLAMWKERVLPPKYFGDSEHIRSLLDVAEPEHSDPFARTALLYRDLGLTDPGVVSTLSYALFVLVVIACIPFGRLARMRLPWALASSFCLVTGAVYLAQFSKELLVLGIVALIACSARGRGWTLMHLGAMGAYAWWIRPYWWLTAAAYLVLVVTLPRVRSVVPLVLPMAVCYLGLAFTTLAVQGWDLTDFRAYVNDGRVFSADAASKITDMIPGEGPLVATANVLVDLVGLMVPFPLLRHGNAMYLGFGVVIGALWVSMLGRAQRAARRGLFRDDARLTRAVALLLAVVCVQAVFEPDYGSYLKHLAPFLPLFLLVMDRTGVDAAPGGTTPVGGGSG